MTARNPDLHLDVWQFVRLMVQMEETLGGPDGGRGSALKSLFDLWEDLWVDLDARLVDLGKRDMDAFADLMMDQEVVLENPPAGAPGLVAQELSKVVETLNRQLARTDDPAQIEDLSFERDALTDTIHQLRGGKGRAGKRPGSKPGGAKRPGARFGAGKGPAAKQGPGKHQTAKRPGPKPRGPR